MLDRDYRLVMSNLGVAPKSMPQILDPRCWNAEFGELRHPASSTPGAKYVFQQGIDKRSILTSKDIRYASRIRFQILPIDSVAKSNPKLLGKAGQKEQRTICPPKISIRNECGMAAAETRRARVGSERLTVARDGAKH